MAKRAMLYGRVSKPRPLGAYDDGTEDLSESVERQLEKCRFIAMGKGYEIVGEERDVQSAFKAKKRPGWERVKAAMERGEVDVVVVWQMDRALRSLTELEAMIDLAERTGAAITTVVGDLDLTTSSGKMVSRILAAVARAEVELKTERMQAANQQRAAQGKRPRSAPRLFGYRPDGTVDPVEADAVRVAANDLLAGVSLYSIAKRWNDAGLFPESRARIASGTEPKWSARGLRDCILNPRHAGLAVYRGEVLEGVEGSWEAILDEEQHIALKAMFSDPSRRVGDHQRGRRPGDLLLSTVARCGKEGCERTLNASSRKGVPQYVCKAGHVTIPAHKVEMLVSFSVAKMAAQVEVAGVRVVERTTTDSSELEALRKRLDDLSAPYAEGAITLAQMTTATEVLRGKIAAAEQAIAEGVVSSRMLTGVEVFETYEKASVEGKRALLREAFDIVVSPVGKGQRVDAMKQVRITPRDEAD